MMRIITPKGSKVSSKNNRSSNEFIRYRRQTQKKKRGPTTPLLRRFPPHQHLPSHTDARCVSASVEQAVQNSIETTNDGQQASLSSLSAVCSLWSGFSRACVETRGYPNLHGQTAAQGNQSSFCPVRRLRFPLQLLPLYRAIVSPALESRLR